jgi:AcrR family transcriptional regulator
MAGESTRDRLVRAAYELFDEKGYDATTVEGIAERAGTGRTTFFRHFGSKEAVIFPDHEALLAQIRSRLAVASRDARGVAVTEAAKLVLLHYLSEGDLARARYRLTSSVPALRDREIAGIVQYQRLFRSFLQEWLGDEPGVALRAELMTACVVTAHNHVLRAWLRGQTKRPVEDFDEAMTEVVAQFAPRREQEGGSAIVVLRSSRNVDDILPAIRQALLQT